MVDVRTKRLPAVIQAALEAADDRKAQHIVALDLRGLSDSTDYFVVASGTSDAHVRGVAASILDRMLPSDSSRTMSRDCNTGAGLCSTSLISSSMYSTRKLAASISSSGSGTTRRW